MFTVRDLFRPPKPVLESFGIGEGMTVVDYGCGPGSFVRAASDLAGPSGTVFAVDIHPLAIRTVERITEKDGRTNIHPVLAHGYDSGLQSGTADLVYALDMFHSIPDPSAFLGELRRITRPAGMLVIDDGHQPRRSTRLKIIESGSWTIEEETKAYLRCRPA
jgi:ubiquinone/menaquinone biosynthesis C-methylase UbiE